MKQLLVAVDFSKNTDKTIEQAAILAEALPSKLWVVHVTSDETQAMIYDSAPFNGFSPEFISMPGDVQVARDLSAEEIKREHAHLLRISSSLRDRGLDAQAILIPGDAANQILAKAADLQADMIILGSKGHGLLHKALLGSVSEAVIRHAACNVLIVPPTGE
jgi:nucleotide-binding universal stress UspA family protein